MSTDRRSFLSLFAGLPAARILRSSMVDGLVVNEYESNNPVETTSPSFGPMRVDLLAHVHDGRFEVVQGFKGLAHEKVGVWRLYYGMSQRRLPLDMVVAEDIEGDSAVCLLNYPVDADNYLKVLTYSFKAMEPIDIGFFFVGRSPA